MADYPKVHKLRIETVGFTNLDNGSIISEVAEVQPVRTNAENYENLVEENIENPDEKYTYRPVITVTKNEVTLTKPGSKLQKITVEESLDNSVDSSTDDIEVKTVEYLDTDNERKIISEVPNEPCEIRVNKNENMKEDNTSNTENLKLQTKNCKDSSVDINERKKETEKPEIEVKEQEEEVIYNKPISKLPKRVTSKSVEAPKMEVSNNTKEEKSNNIATAHIFIPSNAYEGRPNIVSETPTGHNLLRHQPPSKLTSVIPKNNKHEDKTYSKIPKLSKSESNKLAKEAKEKTPKVSKEKTSKTEAKLSVDKTIKPSKDSKNDKITIKEPKEKSRKTFKEKILKIITIKDTGRPEINSDVPISPHSIRDSSIGFEEKNNHSEVVRRPPKLIQDKDLESAEGFFPIERNSVIIDQIINSQVPDEIDDIFEELYDSLADEEILDDEVELKDLPVNETAKTKMGILSGDKPNVHTTGDENIFLDHSEPCNNVSNEEQTTNNTDSQYNSVIINQDILINKETNTNYAIPTTSSAVVKENDDNEIEQHIDKGHTVTTVSNNNQEHLKTNEQPEIILEQIYDGRINNFVKPQIIGIVCDKRENFNEKHEKINPVTEPVLVTEEESNDYLSENINETREGGVSVHTIEGQEKKNIDEKRETSPYIDQPYKSLEPIDMATGQEQVIDTVFEKQPISLQPVEEIEFTNNEKYKSAEYSGMDPICRENKENLQSESTEIIKDVDYYTNPKVNSDTNIITKNKGDNTEYFEANYNEILKSSTPETKEIKSEYGLDKLNVEDFNAPNSFSEPVKTISNEASKEEYVTAPAVLETLQYKPNERVTIDVSFLADETAISHTESDDPVSSAIPDASAFATEEKILTENHESNTKAIDIPLQQDENSGYIMENIVILNTEESPSKIDDGLKEIEIDDDLSEEQNIEKLSESKDQSMQIQQKNIKDFEKETEKSIISVEENHSSIINEDILIIGDTAFNTEKNRKHTDELEINKGERSDENALSRDVENEELEHDGVYTPVLNVTKKETVYTTPTNKLQKITVTEKWEDPWRLLTQTRKEEIETPVDEKVDDVTSPVIDLSRPNYRDSVRQKMKEISDRSSLDSNQTETKRDIKQKESTKPLPVFKSNDNHKPKIVDHLTKKEAKERDNKTYDNYFKNKTEIKKENEIDSNERYREIEKIDIKGKVKRMINRIVNKNPDDNVKNDVKVEHKSDKPEELLKGKVQNVLYRFESREELSEPKKTIDEPKPVNKKFQHILNKFEKNINAEELFEEESKKEIKIEHRKAFKNEEDLAKEAIKGKVHNILKEIESKKDQTVLAKGKSMENMFSSNLDYRREFVRRKSVFEVGNI